MKPMKPMKHGNAMRLDIMGDLIKHLMKRPRPGAAPAMPKAAHVEIDAVKTPVGASEGAGALDTDGDQDGDEGQAAIAAMHAKDRDKMRGM